MRASLFVLVLACRHASAPEQHSTPAPGPADDCPATLPGTSVTVEDVDHGAALVFVTTGATAELRRRVKVWVEQKMVATPNVTSGDPIAHGMRVTYVATNAGEAGKLQDELRMHAHHLAGGTCKMEM